MTLSLFHPDLACRRLVAGSVAGSSIARPLVDRDLSRSREARSFDAIRPSCPRSVAFTAHRYVAEVVELLAGLAHPPQGPLLTRPPDHRHPGHSRPPPSSRLEMECAHCQRADLIAFAIPACRR